MIPRFAKVASNNLNEKIMMDEAFPKKYVNENFVCSTITISSKSSIVKMPVVFEIISFGSSDLLSEIADIVCSSDCPSPVAISSSANVSMDVPNAALYSMVW
tara:strand:- start:72 stop:377 length:306 start_codon:yes stop_codon:yes gene_type:complete